MEINIKNKIINKNNLKLKELCENYNLIIENDINDNINRETKIIGKCKNINCLGKFTKSLCALNKNKIFLCNLCMYKEQTIKLKNTNLERYGVENPLKLEEYKNKSKQTNLKKYGCEYSSQSQQVKDKKEQVFMEKYGVKSGLLLESVKSKLIEKNIKEYGVSNLFESKEIQEKIKQTNKEKYGFENPSQSPDIAEKKVKTAFRKKDYIMPSGNIISCQGYEPFALDELLEKELVKEEDIVTGCKNVPEIWYNDDAGKKHRHFVDIFIPSQNRCIEVKSTWTAKKKQDNIYLKQNAAKELGYNYEIWIYNGKGEKVENII